MRDALFYFGLGCVALGISIILFALWGKMREEEREAERRTGPLKPWEPATRGRERSGEQWTAPGHTFRHDGKVTHRGAHKW